MTPVCPVHKRPLVQFCPACRGAQGGQVVTPAKLASLRKISKRPRPGRRKEA